MKSKQIIGYVNIIIALEKVAYNSQIHIIMVAYRPVKFHVAINVLLTVTAIPHHLPFLLLELPQTGRIQTLQHPSHVLTLIVDAIPLLIN